MSFVGDNIVPQYQNGDLPNTSLPIEQYYYASFSEGEVQALGTISHLSEILHLWETRLICEPGCSKYSCLFATKTLPMVVFS